MISCLADCHKHEICCLCRCVGKVGCDLFDGKWVRDRWGTAYTNRSCGTIPESKNCGKYGKEQGYVHWRWKPDGCELPRFDAKNFLRIVRGKRMAFVGDSVSRNQMESLLCLLSQVHDYVYLALLVSSYDYGWVDDYIRMP